MSVLGRFLWSALDVGLGRSYGIGDGRQNCITFVYAVLVGMYPAVDFTAHHKVLHLDGQPVGSVANIARLCQLGVAVETHDATEVGIYICQGWKGGSGHNIFLARRPDKSLWICDFTPADCDGLEPIAWEDVVARWPTRAIARLVGG